MCGVRWNTAFDGDERVRVLDFGDNDCGSRGSINCICSLALDELRAVRVGAVQLCHERCGDVRGRRSQIGIRRRQDVEAAIEGLSTADELASCECEITAGAIAHVVNLVLERLDANEAQRPTKVAGEGDDDVRVIEGQQAG